MNETSQLREDAIAIWKAGVDAVDSGRLVKNAVQVSESGLVVCGHEIALTPERRIIVVGAGKAGTGMARAFEEALGGELAERHLSGWVNVPADCIPADAQDLPRRIHLHPARPAGRNEPTAAGVTGSMEILKLVSEADREDVCVVLISGGGSALLPAPVERIRLEDKQQVTRLLMNVGATIGELNCVRKQLSRIKGGGLARAAGAGLVVTLIISDVVGDPLDIIASGPTVADSSTPAEALAVLERYASDRNDVPEAVWQYLEATAKSEVEPRGIPETVHNYVVGNNRVALEAAAEQGRGLGYHVESLGSDNVGEARAVGRELAERALSLRERLGGRGWSDARSETPEPCEPGLPFGPAPATHPPVCLLSGGEPVVHVVKTDRPQKGGRNQELVLAGVERLWEDGMQGIVLLSGGTDGEDGPTDAAGAVTDTEVLRCAKDQELVPTDFLAVNNSYPFFEQTGGLLKTGPTHTNVMDLRICLVAAQ